MRASDLIGRRVVDRDGVDVGVVTDLRCSFGESSPRGPSTLRLDALVVSGRRAGSVLGYDRRAQQGPWLVRVIVRHLHRAMRVVAWPAVQPPADPGQGVLRLRVRTDELSEPRRRRRTGAHRGV